MKEKKVVKMCPLTLCRVAGLPLQTLDCLRFVGSDTLLDYENAKKDVQISANALLERLLSLLERLPEGKARTAVFNFRRKFFKTHNANQNQFLKVLLNLSAEDQTVLKSHFDNFINARNTLESITQLIDNLWNTQLLDNFQKMLLLSKDEDFRRSLLFASHDLLAAIMETEKAECHSVLTKKQMQFFTGLWQYISRAAVKTSPFSRFTGLAFYPKKKQFCFEANNSLITPNVVLLEGIYYLLLQHESFYNSLSVSLNPSLCISEDSLKFLFFDGEREGLQTLEKSDILSEIILFISDNQQVVSFEKLKKHLQTVTDESLESCSDFILEILETGLLEWQLPVAGDQPNWASQLVAYLQWLPAEPMVSEVIFFLRFLQTTSRTFTYQSLEEAMMVQKNAAKMWEQLFEKYAPEHTLPLLPPTQVFYEDFATPNAPELSSETLQNIGNELYNLLKNYCWQQETKIAAELRHFFETRKDCSELHFIQFLEQYFNRGKHTPIPQLKPLQAGKIGLVFQIFEDDNDGLCLVLNQLFSGGGKMFQRWLPLDPERVTALSSWVATGEVSPEVVHFPWQGWHNANFYTPLFSKTLAVPGTNFMQNKVEKLPISSLEVNCDKQNEIHLKIDNQPITLYDCGLEALQTRPPAMQILWHLGVRNAQPVIPAATPDWKETNIIGIFYSERKTIERVVIARRSWRVDAEVWQSWLIKNKGHAAFFTSMQILKKQLDLPERCFFRLSGKPQLIDFQIPVAILFFEKNLRQATAQDLFLVEMLPVGGDYAAEWVVELEI